MKNEKPYVLFYCNENMQVDTERFATLEEAKNVMQKAYEYEMNLELGSIITEECYIDETNAYISSTNVCEIWHISVP